MTSRSSFNVVSAPLSELADPPTRLMDAAAMDYFMIELVPTLRRSAAIATERRKKLEKEMVDAGLIPPPAPPPKVDKPRESQGPHDSVTSLTSKISKSPIDDEEEAVRVRLETIGMHVGANFSERCAFLANESAASDLIRLCLNKPLFTETLDAIKFICKDIWVACWDKQVDNLRTNHRVSVGLGFACRASSLNRQGVYVLQDNLFKPIARLSSWQGRADALRKSKIYVALPAGIIKGALSRLGIQATITPEINSLPQCRCRRFEVYLADDMPRHVPGETSEGVDISWYVRCISTSAAVNQKCSDSRIISCCVKRLLDVTFVA